MFCPFCRGEKHFSKTRTDNALKKVRRKFVWQCLEKSSKHICLQKSFIEGKFFDMAKHGACQANLTCLLNIFRHVRFSGWCQKTAVTFKFFTACFIAFHEYRAILSIPGPSEAGGLGGANN